MKMKTKPAHNEKFINRFMADNILYMGNNTSLCHHLHFIKSYNFYMRNIMLVEREKCSIVALV